MKRRDKPIFYPDEVLRKMQNRGVSTQQVQKVVRNPDGQNSARNPAYIVLEKRISARRRLAVVIEEFDTSIDAVSVMWR